MVEIDLDGLPLNTHPTHIVQSLFSLDTVEQCYTKCQFVDIRCLSQNVNQCSASFIIMRSLTLRKMSVELNSVLRDIIDLHSGQIFLPC